MFNDVTLFTYERCAERYIENTPDTVSDSLKLWLHAALAGFSIFTDILEIGSGGGRDADYVEDFGYEVRRTDAAMSFVRLLRAQGHEAERLDILIDPVGSQYDLILADAVFLHFTPEQLQTVLRKCRQSLKPGGRLAFTVKTGGGGGFSNEKLGEPRYFQYWQLPDLAEQLVTAGFATLVVVPGPPQWIAIVTAV